MQRHPENQQHHKHGADPVDDGAILDGGEFFVGNWNRPVSRTRALYSPARLRSEAACLMASVASLPGSSALKSRIGFELDEGTPVGIGERLVAGEFAPGECRRTGVQHLLHGLGDQIEWPLGAIELDLSALDAGQSGLQRAGQPRMLDRRP